MLDFIAVVLTLGSLATLAILVKLDE